jgi:hypothetical protein
MPTAASIDAFLNNILRVIDRPTKRWRLWQRLPSKKNCRDLKRGDSRMGRLDAWHHAPISATKHIPRLPGYIAFKRYHFVAPSTTRGQPRNTARSLATIRGLVGHSRDGLWTIYSYDRRKRAINSGRGSHPVCFVLTLLRCAPRQTLRDSGDRCAWQAPPENWIACAKGAVRVSSTSIEQTDLLTYVETRDLVWRRYHIRRRPTCTVRHA